MAKDKDSTIEPLDGTFDEVSTAIVSPTHISNKNNVVESKTPNLGPTIQEPLFHVEKQIEIDGVEMGVLDNGIPYLTESGLARMCGIDRKALNRLAVNWQEERFKPRGKQIDQLLETGGYSATTLYLKSEHNGSPINAYTEPVCLALLEYYAFVSEDARPEAIRAFRSLARISFREFIYGAVGYSPEQRVLESWRHFHDRIDILSTSVPLGYYSVFREIAGIIVPMIKAGVLINDRVVPDISVGKAWSEYWKANDLTSTYGERIKYEHEYPLYYPQAKSNPQPSFAYPDASLGAFRSWLIRTYLTSKFPAYLLGQTKKGALPAKTATTVLGAFSEKLLENKDN